MAIITLNGTESDQLHSKTSFDMFQTEKKRLSAQTESSIFKTSDEAVTKSDSRSSNNPNISEPLNLYKQSSSSMSENDNFIKLNRCDSALWLMANHPIAYLLLNLVAIRAQRKLDHPSGLKVGEAFLGDHKSIGATRQQYRTALQTLVRNNYLTILETCKTRQKSTTGTTTVGTKVKLLNSDIWDINPEMINHRINHRSTTDQPPINHEQECMLCSCVVCICARESPVATSQKNEILEEQKKIRKQHPNKTYFEKSKGDLFKESVMQRTDWTKEEIDKVWEIFVNYNDCISDFFKFCNGTIQNIRKMKEIKQINSNEERCSSGSKISKTEDSEILKKPSEISKEKIITPVTLGRPLANWKSQIGLE